MIVNPYAHKGTLVPYNGTRILQQDFGLLGTTLSHPFEPKRVWSIQALYAPIPERTLGGFRTKLVDEKGFVTFINQMDLEVLLGVASPDTRCRWSGRIYPDPEDHDFFGLCVDDDDLIDDLFDRELLLRGELPPGSALLSGLELTRRVHVEEKIDVEELWVMLCDQDEETGIYPDTRMETLEQRWTRIERVRLPWEDA